MTPTPDPTLASADDAGARADTQGRWWSSSAGFVSLGAVVLVTLGTFVALFGFGHADHTVQFLRGNAWLTSDETGSVVRVNGATGKPDFEMKLRGAAGDDLQVIQGPDGVFVLNRLTGEVTKLDDAQLQLGGSIKADPADQPLFVTGAGHAFLLGRRTGHVQQVDPKSSTLDAVGAPVELGHAVSNALVDDKGRLVAALPESGELGFAVDGHKDAPVKVAEAGDQLTVSSVSNQLVAVDHTKGTAAPVDPAKGVITVFALEVAAGADIAVVDTMSGDRLWIVQVGKAELLGLDIRTGNQVHVPLPDSSGHDLGAPLPNGHFVYVPDFETGDLVKVDTDKAAVVDKIPVTGGTKGKFDSFVKDDRVWGNDQVGKLAVVIDHDGNPQPVEKYRPGLPSNDDTFDLPVTTTTPTTSKPTATTTPATTAPTKPTTSTTELHTVPDPGLPDSTVPPSTKPPTGPGKPLTPVDPPPPVAAKPGTVAPVSATAADATAHVQWTAAADNGSPLTKYVVFDPVLGPRDVPATATTLDLTGLTNGATYTFTIHAVNAIGDGPTSTTAPVTPQSFTAGAPGNVVATLIADPDNPTSSSAIKLTWDLPTVHPELVAFFQYSCDEIGGTPATPLSIPANTPTYSVILQGQDHTTTTGYACWAQTYDTANVARGRTDTAAANVIWPMVPPAACTGLGHGIRIPNDAKGDFDVQLTWVAPTDDGGRGIEEYEVEIEQDSVSIGWTHFVSLIAAGDATSIQFQNAPPGNYRFHVRALGKQDVPSGLQWFGPFSAYDTF